MQCCVKSYYFATIDYAPQDAWNDSRWYASGCMRKVLGAVLY